jgi:hypothetical protein
MPYVIAVGLLLPTMHQSSLGSLMLLAGAKLHPLWRTPLLPLLFLVSCVGMGYAAVVLEATISSKVFRRPSETPMLRALAGPISVVLLGYALLRLYDVYHRGLISQLLVFDHYTLLFHVEMALFTVPALLLLFGRRRAEAALLATVAVMVILAGALYRFSTYLIAFNPGAEWSYFPSLPEFAVTVGLVAGEIMGYLVLVKRFPILRGAPTHRATPVKPTAPAPAGVSPARAGVPAGVSALVLLALLLGAAPLMAQGAQRAPDRRCLTQQLCLDEPLPASEPHEGRCATCHDFSTQATPAAAAQTCASAQCHNPTESLTPMHRDLSPRVQRNCTGCHSPHNARIVSAGNQCAICHDAGGRRRCPGRCCAGGGKGGYPSLSFGRDAHRRGLPDLPRYSTGTLDAARHGARHPAAPATTPSAPAAAA